MTAWGYEFYLRVPKVSLTSERILYLLCVEYGVLFIVATSVSLEIPVESHIIYLREDHGLPAYPPKIFSPLLITTRVGDFPSHLLWKLAGLNPSLVALYRIPHLASLGSSDIHDSRVFSFSKLVIIDDSLNTVGCGHNWLINPSRW